MRTCLFLLTMLFLAASTSTVYAMTIYVPDDYPTIQAGIDACSDGDTVIVRDGTYTGEGNRDIDFGGNAIVVMSENGPEVTIIDCEEAGRGFYFHSGEEVTSVVQGFTVTNGSGTYGGGINCSSSSPTIVNCTFSDNSVGSFSYGGGMYNNNSSPMVTNCLFIANSVDSHSDGGGMYNTSSNPLVTNCSFIENTVDVFGSGCGMYNDNSNPTVTNCLFIANSGDYFSNGGGMYNEDSNPTITNCTFIENSVDGGGGGMRNSGSNPVISNCTFSGNMALAGCGMRNYYSSPTVINCILWGDYYDEIYDVDSNPTVTYSDLQGGYPGVGNIDADPLFFTFMEFEYFLDAGSPCIDAGIPATSVVEPTEDGISDWHPRWPDWIPNSPHPDMGAYGGPGNVGWLP
jgi:hypothetical protein